MSANDVYSDIVSHLSQYNLEALIEIAYTEFGIKVSANCTKEDIIDQCALVEVENFVH